MIQLESVQLEKSTVISVSYWCKELACLNLLENLYVMGVILYSLLKEIT
jgi:hypothetical protein